MTIHPYRGVGDARLGMTRTELRMVLDGDVRSYKKGAADADQFVDIATHAYYDRMGRCEAFEIYAPASVRLFDTEVVGVPFRDALQFLQTLDGDVQELSSGARSLKFGVSLYAPYAEEEPEAPVEAVFIFATDYWD